ncbi:ABC transporter substrate-binding protein [Actinotignum urinale]|uniref:ABC transporter substrate-binding protein n=1 Tax=Actinotignum urinale TaxID=190146 RepID=A0ABU5G7M6_9ACTO|nr:ABC transporter substrate-binding protein [Actinotignum urinale]MDY5133160.1 ABC transporter substrate-binding protein [Actinotignum urinale]WIK59653.1 ABC transporter substrate-binding protein [Actinotignum urinale]
MKKRLVALAAATTLAFTACSASSSDKKSDSAGGKTLVNCGMTFDYSKPAQRIVAVEQGAISTTLDMGQVGKMAGYSHLKEKIPAKYEKDFAKVKKLSDKPATAAQIRTAEPDMIYTNFKVTYTADKGGTREEWQKLGVKPFLSNLECANQGDNKGKSRFELLEKDFDQIGKLWGAEKVAEEQIKNLREAVAAAKKHAGKDKPTFAVVYSMYNGVPYIGGKLSLAQDMIEAVGGRNVFDDLNDSWPEVSWEALADKNPDYLILVDLPMRGKPGDTWQEKVDAMNKEASIKKMDAVVGKKFIPVPGGGFDPSSTTATTLKEFVSGYEKLKK